MQDFEDAYRECRQAAIDAGALEPHGFKEGVAANWMSYQGQSFADTPLAQSRLQEGIKECLRRKGFAV